MIRVPLRASLKGSIGILKGHKGLGSTWRFMGSYDKGSFKGFFKGIYRDSKRA